MLGLRPLCWTSCDAFVVTGQTFSNPHYKVETVQSTVPTESQSWGSLKAEFR